VLCEVIGGCETYNFLHHSTNVASLGLNKTDEPHKSSAYNYYLEESKGSKSSKKGLHSYLVNATNSTTATSNSSKSYRGTEESEDVSEGFTNSLFSAKAAKFIKEDEGDSGMSDLGDAETNSKLSRSNNSTNTTNTASNSISTNVDGLGQATANATLSFTAPSDPGLSPAGLSLASTQGYAWKEVSVAAVILIVSAWYL
jgi:hypothetical protein